MLHRAAFRAIKNRKKYLETQPARSILKYLRISYFYNKNRSGRKRMLKVLNSYNNIANFKKGRAIIKDACIVTGRSIAVTSINVSRMQVRDLMISGALRGLKKHY
jgi:ribosomal protein S14